MVTVMQEVRHSQEEKEAERGLQRPWKLKAKDDKNILIEHPSEWEGK